MASCLNNPVLGRNLTDNFTFNETTKQIVPKPGTDTKPGALALNLGNNLPADATNATDALTASGFNAMANAADTNEPLCGNEIQQAVTAAVAQSIGCDADAQEAIACAIASNPDAIACLKAALPSGGGDATGTLQIDANLQTYPYPATVVDWTDGVTTQLTNPAFILGSGESIQRSFFFQSPSKFSSMLNTTGEADVSSTPVWLIDGEYVAGTPIVSRHGSDVINQEGTRLFVVGPPGETGYSKAYTIPAEGPALVQNAATFDLQRTPAGWVGEDLLQVDLAATRATLNADTNVLGTIDPELTFFDIDPRGEGAYSQDYSMFAKVRIVGSPARPEVTIRKVTRSGNDITSTLVGTQVLDDVILPIPEVTYTGAVITFTWTPDNAQVIVIIAAEIPNAPTTSFSVNVGETGFSIDRFGLLQSGTAFHLRHPRINLANDYMTAISREGTCIFKRSGDRWQQIGEARGYWGNIPDGAGGYSGRKIAGTRG